MVRYDQVTLSKLKERIHSLVWESVVEDKKKHNDEHVIFVKQKPNQRWRPAQRSSGGALPEAVLTDMQNRELQDEDYELLLQLDR